ncbi:hypothetical protein POL74_13310 [Clostridioides difficile]|nr:hypothetical protein [Clostridioides difficile]
MADIEVYRTIRKRKGVYSQSDICLHSFTYDSINSTYYGRYRLSTLKNLSITKTVTYKFGSYEVYIYVDGREVIQKDYHMYQNVAIQVVPDPTISIKSNLGVISEACSIKYNIYDNNPDIKFKITVKLNDVVINEKYNTADSNYTIDLTDEYLSKLTINSVNNVTVEISTDDGGKILDKTVTFTKGNSKPKINISSYNSTSTTFTVSDLDNNLSKIEWYLDDVLKETITTDLTAEKTINYELTDNAIHTLKIVATDAEGATVEKVLSISKEIMPLQSDATLQDISSKLVEIGEGFRNGKTSIINTLALKNIEASLNNTLVELSEKIKTSFDSSDASVQDLMNQLTQANNTISQLNTQINGLNSKYKYAYSTDVTLHWYVDCGFRPDFVIYDCQTTRGRLFVILTPSIYACFDTSNRRWSIISSDYENSYAYSKNNINSYYGTEIRNTGFNCSAMPGDSLNDKYYFYYAIKCL